VVDTQEVASVRRVPLAELAEPANRLSLRHPSGQRGPAFRAGGMLVWGFTAGLLDGLLRAGGWEQPWQPSRIEDLPADVVALAGRGGRYSVPVEPATEGGLAVADPTLHSRRRGSSPGRGEAL
jgi:hypothetical protein